MGELKYFDCLIIGAGISGLDAAYHIKEHCKWACYAILERRENLGGTWDFFKYPGIRSDSPMYRFGFSWKVWQSAAPFASGDELKAYLNEAAEEQGIKKKIHFNTDIKTAEWKSEDNQWHLETTTGQKYSCKVLIGCTGYYSYENPFEPTFPGQENFLGVIVHPQKWKPEHDTMIKGKRVALIGSGATAVTILPSIADQASHVTMIQRTPTYIGSTPGVDPWVKFFKDWLPTSIAGRVNRWKSIVEETLFYQYCTRDPDSAKKFMKDEMYKAVESVMSREEFEKHFTPPYNPYQQRICTAPDGDFFKPICEKKATMVTGHIDHLTEKGIQMKSGEHVEADIIITATGITLQPNFPFSTMQVTIDGEAYKPPEHLIYNGVMLNDVPNFAFIIGYIGIATWTLKADIASLYFTKLLNYMKNNKIEKVVPKKDSHDQVKPVCFGTLCSGYFTRSEEILPKYGDKYPWRGSYNYIIDLLRITSGGFCRDSLEFTVTDKKNT